MNKFIKVAIATDDGKTISAHLGRAKYFEIITISDGNITGHERIPKEIHPVSDIKRYKSGIINSFMRDNSSFNRKYKNIIPSSLGCTHVIVRGMGSNAYHGLLKLDINPILTDIRSVDEAIKALISGSIISHTNRIH